MHPNLTLAQSIAKDKQFQIGRKWGLVEQIGTKSGGLPNWSLFLFLFWQTCCFQNWFLVQMRLKWNLLNWVLAKFLGLGAENLPNYVFWTENWEILWFLIKKGHGNLEELKNAEKVFFFFSELLREPEMRVFSTAHPHSPFSQFTSTPKTIWLNGAYMFMIHEIYYPDKW